MDFAIKTEDTGECFYGTNCTRMTNLTTHTVVLLQYSGNVAKVACMQNPVLQKILYFIPLNIGGIGLACSVKLLHLLNGL